jgi:hypothetical protein
MTLTNGSGFGSRSWYFCHWSSRCQQKTFFLNYKKFFCLLPYLLKVHLHNFSKIKSQSHKTVGITVFLTIFAWCRIRIQEAKKIRMRIRVATLFKGHLFFLLMHYGVKWCFKMIVNIAQMPLKM